MTITVRELLDEINKQVEAKPGILDLPVFIALTDECAIYSHAKVGKDYALTEDDVFEGAFDDDDIGRRYFELEAHA